MKPCKLCSRYVLEINDKGICPKCMGDVPKSISFTRDGVNLYPHRNNLIIDRDEWNRIKSEIDKYYRFTLDDTINKYNYKIEEKQRIKDEQKLIYPGVVYILKSGNGYYKIGKANNLERRLNDIQRQYPIKIEVIHHINCINPYKAEAKLHHLFNHFRLWGEWFELDQDSISWLLSIKTDRQIE